MLLLFRRLFGIRKEKTLRDFDNLNLFEVDGSIQKEEFNGKYTFGVKPKSLSCKKCNSDMLKFDPEIKLGTRFLHACSKCDWREYL